MLLVSIAPELAFGKFGVGLDLEFAYQQRRSESASGRF